MTYGIFFEKAGRDELPQGLYYAHVPALGLTTHGEGIEGAGGGGGFGHALVGRKEGIG